MVYKDNKLVKDVVIRFQETVLSPLGIESSEQIGKFGVDEFEWFLSSFGIRFPGNDNKVSEKFENLSLQSGRPAQGIVNRVPKQVSTSRAFSGYINTSVKKNKAEDDSDEDW